MMRIRERSAGDRGASLVEFAFVAPLLFLLILAMVDFGFAYGDYIGVRSGVREGARQAAINPPGSRSCAISGTTPNAATTNLVCLTKERVGLDEDDIRVAIDFEDSTPEVGDSVTVCADVALRSTSGMTAPFLEGRRSKSETTIRLEVAPGFSEYSEGGLAC